MTSKQGIEAKAERTPLALTLSEVTELAKRQGSTPVELASTLLGKPTERYVTAQEVGDFYGGKSAQTVHQWRKAGKITGIKPGKEWLFVLSDVRDQLARVTPDVKPVQSPQSRGRRRLGG